ncbi:TPR repeat-containing protein [Reichenbachiella faecimaris]|uniref:TPR repeat-containing protein n=1 Tax=Reichenbachiella faecimaris TaxID=692418 RepID=A0A1W2G7V4_REIFA|nr:GDSL-type esterase/lipase family protein [Reichenbachiella faecimaris]SMD32769.1 TPR repeat-containing protein [Reichenbachiella faecimaris]
MKMTNENQRKPTLFVYYVIMALLPVLFFVFVELGLVAFNYGNDYSLFIKPDGGTPGMLYLNPQRSYKYFGDLKGTVFFKGIGFKEKKEPDSFRIFVLGGSSAQGFPYAQNAAFPSHLKRRLDLLHPNQSVEVINLGASAINTHTLLDMLPEVLAQQPDLLLIYAGHNEYYGALGPASSRSFGICPAFVSTLLWLKEFKTFQLMEGLVASISYGQPKHSANLMEDMIGESFVYQGSSVYEAGLSQFQYNMKKILSLIQTANVPVILGTLSSNLKDHKPFNSDEKDETGRSAVQHFELAHRLLGMGDFAQARQHFIKAKELDGLRFRAPEKINETIRQLTKEFDVPLVEVDDWFNNISEEQIVGNNLMCDHLHPNLRGYFELSKAYYTMIEKHGLLPSVGIDMAIGLSDSLLLATMPFTKLDSVQADLTLVNLLGNYPYVPKGMPNPLLHTIRQDDFVDQMGAVKNVDSARVIIAGRYLLDHDLIAFRREMDVFSSYFPSKEKPYLSMISYLEEKGMVAQSIPLLIDQLSAQPETASKNKMLGLLQAKNQTFRSSITYFSKAINQRSEETSLYIQRGIAYAMTDNFPKAVQDFEIALRLEPDNLEAHHQRGVARFELKDYAGTIEDFNEIIASGESVRPLPYFIRGYAFYGLGNQESACADWKMAASYGHLDAKKLSRKFCN